MTRIVPSDSLVNMPCSVVAVTCAAKTTPMGLSDYLDKLRDDGYASLDRANRFIRDNVRVKKRINYVRSERVKLKDLHLDGEAVVCVKGHFLYLDHETYWSFFDNENDDVVTVWLMR